MNAMSVLVLLLALATAQAAELHERFLEGREYFAAGDYEAARQTWLPLAEAGDPQAQFSIAFLHEQGLGVPTNHTQAAYWYERAALQGLAVAQYNLGNAYLHGRGVVVDSTVAARLWRLAAQQGLIEAQYNLAAAQLQGSAAIQWPGEPVLLLRSAAAAGHTGARDLLANEAFGQVRDVLIPGTDGGIQLALEPKWAVNSAGRERSETGRLPDLEFVSEASPLPVDPETLGDYYVRLAARSYGRVSSLSAEVKRGIVARAESAAPAKAASLRSSDDNPMAALQRWSEAWAAQEVRRYLAQYSENFVPADGIPLSAWRDQRVQRISNPEFIKIQISNPQLREISADRVAIEFNQDYQSDRFQDKARKRLELVLEQGRWRIVRERSLP